MTQSIPILSLTVDMIQTVAAHRFVTHTGRQSLVGSDSLGVTRTAAEAGDKVTADVIGTTIVEVGGPVAVGQGLETDANNKVILATSGPIVARALEAATADGDLIEALLIVN